MSFKTDFKDESGSQGRKYNNLILRPGTFTVRVLEEDYKTFYVHWISTGRGGYNIACLGSDDCPICIDNFKIIAEHPEDFRSIKGWNGRRKSCYVNVLDRTLVKKCANCGGENNANQNGDYQPACWSCNESIMDVIAEPSNTVKIFSRGPETFEQLESYDATIFQARGVNLTEYDLQFILKPRDNNSTGSNLTILPLPDSNAPVEYEEPLYELENALVRLSASEIREAQSGVALRDIFKARGQSDQETTVQAIGNPENDATAQVQEDVESSIQNLLSELGYDSE